MQVLLLKELPYISIIHLLSVFVKYLTEPVFSSQASIVGVTTLA